MSNLFWSLRRTSSGLYFFIFHYQCNVTCEINRHMAGFILNLDLGGLLLTKLFIYRLLFVNMRFVVHALPSGCHGSQHVPLTVMQ